MAGVRQSWAIAVCEHRHLNPPPQRGEPAGDDLGVEFVLEIAPEGSPDAVIETDDKEIQIAGARETAATCCLSRSNTALPGSGKKSRFQVEWIMSVLVYVKLDFQVVKVDLIRIWCSSAELF